MDDVSQRARAESVDEVTRGRFRSPAKTANHKAVPQAAEAILPRHTRRDIEDVVQSGGADLLDRFQRDHRTARKVLQRTSPR